MATLEEELKKALQSGELEMQMKAVEHAYMELTRQFLAVGIQPVAIFSAALLSAATVRIGAEPFALRDKDDVERVRSEAHRCFDLALNKAIEAVGNLLGVFTGGPRG